MPPDTGASTWFAVGVHPTRISATVGYDVIRFTAMFSAAKDMMTSKAAKTYVNDLIKTYGRVDELSVDSKRRRIDMRCQLSGEVSPIGVTIEKYQLEQRDGKTYLEVLDSSATRPWMQAAMRTHLHGRKIAVPSWVASAL